MSIKTEILIIDFGSQYTQLLGRRIRSLGYYVEVVEYSITLEEIQQKYPALKALILSGGPASVYEEESYKLDEAIWEGSYKILGICYGMQLLVQKYGGKIGVGRGQYGFSPLSIKEEDLLFESVAETSQVWMSHSDQIFELSQNFRVLATSEEYVGAIRHNSFDYWGIQFHPEVEQTTFGLQMLENFCRASNLEKNWDLTNFIEEKIVEIRNQVGDSEVLLAFSGGVDSFTSAVLINKAIGRQLHCVFVDHGLLTQNSLLQHIDYVREHYQLNIKVLNSQDYFFAKLKGISDPDQKRKIIGAAFIDVFLEYQKSHPQITFLAQGTIYSDVIESAKASRQQKIIKNHHNVGGLPEKLDLKLLEPMRVLFKDEVREISKKLGIEERFINTHPFPGPGLAIRVIGEITPQKCQLLRQIDAIYIDELKTHNLYNQISQAAVFLLPVKSVGVKGDNPTYGLTAVLRAVKTNDFMTAEIFAFDYKFLISLTAKIINQVPQITRVLYDLTSKPPGTIEWE